MKLIKLNESHYIIVDDSEIKEGDFFYSTTKNISGGNVIKQCTGIGVNAWDGHVLSDNTDERGYHPSNVKKITHSTQPLEYVQIYADIKSGWYWGKIKQLSLSEVKNLLGEVDVEKKSYAFIKKVEGSEEHRLTYIDGYRESLEDNKDKIYTEEDIKNAFSRYAFASTSNQPYNEDELLNEFHKFIQSLRPKTERDVTFDERGKLKLV